MNPLTQRAHDLRDVVEEILDQYRTVDEASANGPHADLSCQELRLVEHLDDAGPRMMRELAEYLRLAVSSVTSVIDNLEKKKIVRRNRSEQDRRIVRVELTDSGRVVSQAALKEKTQLLRSMLAALTDDEQEIFMVLFRKIARAGRSQVRKIAPSA